MLDSQEVQRIHQMMDSKNIEDRVLAWNIIIDLNEENMRELHLLRKSVHFNNVSGDFYSWKNTMNMLLSAMGIVSSFQHLKTKR